MKKTTKLADFFTSCDTWEFLKCQNFSQIFRCRVGPSSNAQWIKYWNARFFIKRIFWKISSKTHSQKFLVGNIFQETTWKVPWGIFWKTTSNLSWGIFFWKTISNLPWGIFFKTTPNLLWGIFLANNLKSSLRDFFGKQPQIFFEGLFLKRTWYRPWGRGRRTFWPLISGIGSGLLVLLKNNWLQSHFRKRQWFVGSPENQLTTALNYEYSFCVGRRNPNFFSYAKFHICSIYKTFLEAQESSFVNMSNLKQPFTMTCHKLLDKMRPSVEVKDYFC